MLRLFKKGRVKLLKEAMLIFVFLILSSGYLKAQYEYEPSSANPYGLPNPEAPVEIEDYQEMIGICDCKSLRKSKDGVWGDPVAITWEFKYIMNGMAVQDLTLKTDGNHAGSIRLFDKTKDKWYVHYYSSANPTPKLSTWEGAKKEKDIVLYKSQAAPNGMEGYYKITFHDISDKGFSWLGEWVNTDETFKLTTWKIECLKRK